MKYVGLDPLPPEFANLQPPMAFVVDEDCIGCDRCIPLCFFDALVMIDKPGHKYKRVALVDPDYCTGCGLCFEACPTNAFLWLPDFTNGRQVAHKLKDAVDRDL